VCFNDERVVRAVRIPHPVVTGVGHEIDFTLSISPRSARSDAVRCAEVMTPDGEALRYTIGSGPPR